MRGGRDAEIRPKPINGLRPASRRKSAPSPAVEPANQLPLSSQPANRAALRAAPYCPLIWNVATALPPTSETAVAVYPPGLSILRFGKVAIPAALVIAVLPLML